MTGTQVTAGSAATLAVIPARGGSKRIPRKNIRPFLGVPLLSRTIGMLRDTGLFDRIVVSTDDDEITAVAASAGAEIPFRRPAELANDTAITAPVMEHAVRAMESSGSVAEFVCCVYPAAVLALKQDFFEALEFLRAHPAFDYAFAATSFPYPIQRALRPRGEGCEMFWPEHRDARSQTLEPAFHDAGQFYWGRRQAWLQKRPVFSARSHMLLLPRFRVQDIDVPEDWERAEMIFELAQGRR
jgi:N-acylneuraminate cytidylyltransferase